MGYLQYDTAYDDVALLNSGDSAARAHHHRQATPIVPRPYLYGHQPMSSTFSTATSLQATL